MSRDVLELSSTYQALHEEAKSEGRAEGLAEGRAEGALALILRLGTRRFGAPSVAIRERLEAIEGVEARETLAERLLVAESWDQLLA